jgi:NADH-quinone oxidoreductase subunit C
MSVEDLAKSVDTLLGSRVASRTQVHGEFTIVVAAEEIVDVLTRLRDDKDCQFEVLIDICGVDYPERARRFDVVYHLLSMRKNQRIRVKVEADADTPVPSVIDAFPAANWYERETYDMYGILFAGHPDLRRLLTDYGSRATPCARISPSPATSRCATTTPRNASSTSP